MHEIITIQFGDRANHVGTHYWNTQESYFTYSDQEQSPVDHDRSWRQGIGAGGIDTYTPRLLVYDLKGAFGTQRRINELYQSLNQPDPSSHNIWNRNATTIQAAPIPPHPYIQSLSNGGQMPLDPSTVRYWSDYNRVYYHPRTTQQISEFEHNNPLTPFVNYDAGEELYDTKNREEDILDTHLRPLMEECDLLQAIQMIGSTDDAWGGFATKFKDALGDNFRECIVWMCGLTDTEDGRGRTRQAAINHVRSTIGIAPSVDMFIPLSLPRRFPSYIVETDWRNTPWYTAAMRSMLFESMTLPSRIREGYEGSVHYAELSRHASSPTDLQMGAASMSILEDQEARPEEKDARMLNGLEYDVLAGIETILDIDFFPRIAQGQSQNRLWSTYTSERSKHQTPVEYYSADIKHINVYNSLLHPQQTSFPDLTTFNAEQYSVKTALSASDKIAEYLDTLARTSRTVLDIDEREGTYNDLLRIAESYHKMPGFSDDEDDEDDDD